VKLKEKNGVATRWRKGGGKIRLSIIEGRVQEVRMDISGFIQTEVLRPVEERVTEI
jgi:hypothetical protein